jgi:hypothetical protein
VLAPSCPYKGGPRFDISPRHGWWGVDAALPRRCRHVTHDLYTTAAEPPSWEVPLAGQTRFNWEYDDGRERLLSLYQKGKDKQWDSVKRIDWDLDVDPYDSLGLPDQAMAIYGTPYWDRMSEQNIRDLRQHLSSWQFSQFMHGEQGAMITGARIVETVPDLDAKFYSATQTMDEARHVEIFSKFLHERSAGLPDQPKLQQLLTPCPTRAGYAVPGHAGPDRGSGVGRIRAVAGHHDQAVAQADPHLCDAG